MQNISCLLDEDQEILKLTKRVMYMNNGINTEEFDELCLCQAVSVFKKIRCYLMP